MEGQKGYPLLSSPAQIEEEEQRNQFMRSNAINIYIYTPKQRFPPPPLLFFVLCIVFLAKISLTQRSISSSSRSTQIIQAEEKRRACKWIYRRGLLCGEEFKEI